MLLALASACGEVPAPADAGAADAAADVLAVDALDVPLDAPPASEWRFEPIDGGACANGSAYGVAVSLGRSDDVVLLLEGGGACWDDTSCNVTRTALGTHDDLDPDAVLAAGRARAPFLFSRDPALGPFAAATFVDVPYCTGDFHVGDAVRDYAGGTIRHVGARNLAGALALAATLSPDAARVFVVGSSSGGFGAALAWAPIRAAFPGAEVHVLADSAPLFAVPDERWALMRDAWSARLPDGCAACASSLVSVVEHHLATAPPDARFGLLQHTDDAVTRAYFGLAPGVLPAALTDWSARFAASAGHRTFLVAGERHIVLVMPDAEVAGVSPRAWTFAFVSGAGWTNVGP